MNSEETQTARLEQNKKRLIYAAIAVAVVSSAWYVYDYFQAQKELRAGDALVSLNKAPEAGGKPVSPEASAYLKVAGDYPGTSAAEHALLLAAGALFTENKFKEASAKFEEFTTKYAEHGDSPLLAAAALGRAACLDAQKETDKAREAYKQAKLASAFLYEVKKPPEQALKLYNELAPLDKPNVWTREVESRREQLLIKNPQLAATKPPVLPKITQLPVPPKVGATNGTNAIKITPKVQVTPKAGTQTNAPPLLINTAPAKKNP